MIDRIFLEHPRSVNESYAAHFIFALSFSGQLLLAGLAALVHAFVPILFEKTASNLIKKMNRRMEDRLRN